jgi:hypothetical protein
MLKNFEIIEWLDHCTFTDSKWRSTEDVNSLTPVKVLTLGFVVSEDKTCIRVVSTAGENEALAGEFLILKKAIVRRKRIASPWKGWSK